METLKVNQVDTPVKDVPEKNLRWYANECRNTKLQGIAKRELARRAGGAGGAPKALPSQALARQQDAPLAIEGNFRDPQKATAALKAASEAFHLISPATMVGALPEGCAVALALVRVSPDDPHLYRVGDKVALDKTHLAQLGNAAGASIVESRRTDDCSDPHYCAWTVRVRYRQLDGTWAYKQGSVEQDLREPFGAEYVDAVEKAREKDRDPTKQLRELRRFITRHAESKALNRAYSAIGIRRAYTSKELERPFCVARVVFTGQSDDPQARAQFRAGIMQSFLTSSEDAFGPERQAAPMMPLAAPPPQQLQDYSMPPTYEVEGEEYDEPEQAQESQQQAEPADTEMDRGANPENY